MQSHILNFFSNLLDWFSAVPSHQWFIVGTVAASIPAVIAIVEWVKKHHVKVKAEALATHFILLNITVWSAVMTIASFVITNGTDFATFLPFLREVMPTIMAAAPVVYSIAKAIKAWFAERKKQESLDTVKQIIDKSVAYSATPVTPTPAPQPQPAPPTDPTTLQM